MRGILFAAPGILTTEDQRLQFILRLRSDLYCVAWDVKLYSLTDTSVE